jgi:thioredoxin 1
MAMADLLAVDEKSFETEVLGSETPVLVDFWATWCGPCLALGPTVDAVAKELEGRVKVVKIDIDQNRALANKYQVMSIPLLALFKGGKVVEQMLGGNQRKEGIVAKIERHL